MLLSESFFKQDALFVAQNILGNFLLRKLPNGQILKCMVTETEAYTQDDPASHSYKGKTLRNAPMFLEGGYCYVYLIYGVYHCLNIVTGPEGDGQAVLVRALEIFDELNPFQATGPGKLCRYLNVDKKENGILFAPENGIWFEEKQNSFGHEIVSSTRIGISKAQENKWRFYIKDHKSVSKLR